MHSNLTACEKCGLTYWTGARHFTGDTPKKRCCVTIESGPPEVVCGGRLVPLYTPQELQERKRTNDGKVPNGVIFVCVIVFLYVLVEFLKSRGVI